MDNFPIGVRVRLSALGRKRCPRTISDTGVVVSKATHLEAVRLKMDGKKQLVTLHVSYVELDHARLVVLAKIQQVSSLLATKRSAAARTSGLRGGSDHRPHRHAVTPHA